MEHFAPTLATSKPAGHPPLEDRLRYIDITFDAAKEAHRRLIISGEIEAWCRATEADRARKVSKLAMRIIAQAVLSAGLHPGVLSPSARKAYDTILEEEAADRLMQVRVAKGMAR